MQPPSAREMKMKKGKVHLAVNLRDRKWLCNITSIGIFSKIFPSCLKRCRQAPDDL